MNLINIRKEPSIKASAFKKYSSLTVLVDENTRLFCYDLLKNRLPSHHLIEVPSGEVHKNLTTCQFIWQRLTDYTVDRHSLLVVLGGGVLGDMGGFCAATFKRGIDFFLIPTTLLSQVDASIGGKLGVDFGPYKNQIGVFQQPISTQIATVFLDTLPEAELRSGFAEVIKHCLISDKGMWQTIRKKRLEEQDWLALVKHSAKFKSAVVKKDPREKGLRKILNFGHTIGHALEGHFLASGAQLYHGEAVAAGMAMEAHIAAHKKLISQNDLKAIEGYLFSIFGKIDIPEAGKWIALIKQDKKNKGNKTLMALPKQIGKAVWDVSVSGQEIRDSIDYYRSYQM